MIHSIQFYWQGFSIILDHQRYIAASGLAGMLILKIAGWLFDYMVKLTTPTKKYLKTIPNCPAVRLNSFLM
jgi:hypothetical protein